eukprot:Partr_v1_DN23633_c0_g1_i1_m19096 putative ribosome production factor 2 homolog
MIRTVKPKTARGKRVLKNRAPKVQENTKTALFFKSSKTSQVVNDALKDLSALKKPYSINFTRKNDVHPFDAIESVNEFCAKNDTSLFVMGSHQKKRPHMLTMGRLFDGHVMDMMELLLTNFKAFSDFSNSGCGIGQKPLFVFSGALFETCAKHVLFKSLLLDFFRGEELKDVALNGLEHVISVTAVHDRVLFRVHNVHLKKSGTKVPRVELSEMGPHFDFTFGRVKEHDAEQWKAAMRVPKEKKARKVKNIKNDDMGDKFGRIHLGRQDLTKLQTRKMKGLKRSREEVEIAEVEE